MRRSFLSRALLVAILLGTAGALSAFQVNEIQERVQDLRKEAKLQAERGDREQAERLEREAAKLLQAAAAQESKAKGREKEQERPEIDKQVRQLQDRLNELRAKQRKLKEAKAAPDELAEVRERIANTERELHKIHAEHAGRDEPATEIRARAEAIEAASRRIHHLRVAAENLKLAEAHEIARDLMKQAEAMEREVQQARRQLAEAKQKVKNGEHSVDVIRSLRAEMEQLRAELKELRQQLQKR